MAITTSACVAIWLPSWAVVVVLEEALSKKLGLDAPSTWSGRSAAVLAFTCLEMVVMAPLCEELLFRGIIYSQLQRLRFGAVGAVVGSALIFGGFHFQYLGAAMGFVVVDGIVFGLARWHTRSVPLCFVLHAMGNLFAYVERLLR